MLITFTISVNNSKAILLKKNHNPLLPKDDFETLCIIQNRTFFLIYCRHVLDFPMVFVHSQNRLEITMYSFIYFFMFYFTYSLLQSAPKKKSKHRKL